MTSINHFPTFQYSQPEEYHFSHDSVFLARRVFEMIRELHWQPQSALDLCAGCGIVGLDLLFHLTQAQMNSILEFDFLEIQKQYADHFAINLARLGPVSTTCKFVFGNYADSILSELRPSYDLIVCNPPYFSIENGRVPPNELKRRSRFFVDSDLKALLDFFQQRLSNAGFGFLLVRDLKEHKQEQISHIHQLCVGRLGGQLQIQSTEDIRGTHLVVLRRRP